MRTAPALRIQWRGGFRWRAAYVAGRFRYEPPGVIARLTGEVAFFPIQITRAAAPEGILSIPWRKAGPLGTA